MSDSDSDNEYANAKAARKESVGKIAFIIYPPEKQNDPPLNLNLGFKIKYDDPVIKLIGPDTEEAIRDLNTVLPIGLKCVKVKTTNICCGNVVFIVILESQQHRVFPWSIIPRYWNCECGGIYSHIC
uniref:Uncharacterized protein n=1 Tax=viral metagenome TaxID=1070528 RepID=A0A6C0F0V5_9ZZZZ